MPAGSNSSCEVCNLSRPISLLAPYVSMRPATLTSASSWSGTLAVVGQLQQACGHAARAGDAREDEASAHEAAERDEPRRERHAEDRAEDDERARHDLHLPDDGQRRVGVGLDGQARLLPFLDAPVEVVNFVATGVGHATRRLRGGHADLAVEHHALVGRPGNAPGMRSAACMPRARTSISTAEPDASQPCSVFASTALTASLVIVAMRRPPPGSIVVRTPRP